MQDGDMTKVCALLGSPWRVSGHVLHGKKLGRTLGFPTLNLRVSDHTAARFGIYVVRVHGLAQNPLPGIASLGKRPTVDDDLGVLLETHVLDADVQAYGKLVSIELLQHVRDEEKFPDLTSLTAAMQRDRQHAMDYFAHHGLQDNT
jgi:riboflavin kinase/FMN adenylyltransferase